MSKYICIHGHFYQPPRENAWLEEIEIQESAAPYHNWNDRISNECYRPNGVSRILNEEGSIIDIVSNYAKMSFNFGPTLLSYLEKYHPTTYKSILDADKESMSYFGGYGSALAQVYNHIIMPLANRRDKVTQVRWGLYDFEKRFQRKAAGIWLAETAVDTETLEVLAEEGLKFTILAPNQAKRFRKIGSKDWTLGIDPKRPYLCNLPSGKSIYLYFYDGDRSQAVAFKGILNDGKAFAHELLSGFSINQNEPELVHIATDGESYGHHHRNGDMALAYCMRYIEEQGDVKITNYEEFLDVAPITYEVEIHENSSWSCAHGVERWRSDCGCKTGGELHWTQQWRKPLRESLEWLQNEIDVIFEKEVGAFHPNPWELRNSYIEILYNRTPETRLQFFKTHFSEAINPVNKTHIIRLLESQKHALYMFTSCGWFFTELSGIETVQILQYANRAIQLIESQTNNKLSDAFKDLLAEAKSNLPQHENGKVIYEKWVEPKRLSLTQVGIHYAVSALFADNEQVLSVLNYECSSDNLLRLSAGNLMIAMGRTKVKSKVTGSRKKLSFGILYLGNHHMLGSTGPYMDEASFLDFSEKVKLAFEASDIAAVNELMTLHLPNSKFSFFDLYKDEQLKILKGVLQKNTDLAMGSFKRIYDRNYALLNLMRDQQLTLPSLLHKNLEIVVTQELEAFFDASHHLVPIHKLKEKLVEIEKWNLPIDYDRFNYIISRKISCIGKGFGKHDNAVELLKNLHDLIALVQPFGFQIALNGLQNFIFNHIKKNHLNPEEREKAIKLARLIHLVIA
ncbi:MAG: DUF3536 domain-containing protein [Schleiferiaceae bacterium]|nr:DUF3536 domain-containing protein [Schleiferiaceae bacterium]